MSKRNLFILGGVLALGATAVALAYLYDYAKAVGGKVLHVQMDDDSFRHTLNNLCPKGSSPAEIDEYLGTPEIEHSYDPSTRRVSACVRDQRRLYWGSVRPVVLITVQFDENERVSDVSFHREYTGP